MSKKIMGVKKDFRGIIDTEETDFVYFLREYIGEYKATCETVLTFNLRWG
jgi:hypothetical protein